MRSSPSGVTSAMIDRVGLNPTLIAKSSDNTMTSATPRIASKPSALDITPIFGNASRVSAAIVPPTRMKGLRRPFQSQTRSDIAPMMTCPKMPAIGPAAHTRPMSCTSRLYLVSRIQLSAASCTDNAKPRAVAGRASIARNVLLRSCCIFSISLFLVFFAEQESQRNVNARIPCRLVVARAFELAGLP